MYDIRQELPLNQTLKEPWINRRHMLQAAFMLVFTAGMVYMSFQNYLLFHGVIEMLSIGVAFMVFIIAANTGRFISAQSGYLSILGIALGIIGVFDLVHTLAFKGMGVFPGNSANLPTELWIASRYLLAFAVLLSGIFIDRQEKVKRILPLFVGGSLLLFASIIVFDVFPDCYIDGVGLTDFKKTSEVAISLMLAAGALLLISKRKAQQLKTFWILIVSVLFMIVSDIVFIFYIDVYGLSNMIGHIAKLISYYLIYKAIVEVSLLNPIIELARSEKKYANLIERLPEAILICGDDGIVFANPAARALFGDARLKDSLDNLLGRGSEIRLGDHESMRETQIARPDGSSAHVEVKTLPIVHQGQPSSLAIIYDVTTRKAVEQVKRRNAELLLETEILRKNEQDYLEIINGSTEASWIYDFENSTLKYSDEWKQRIGAEHVSDADMNRFAQSLVHPDDMAGVKRQRQAIYENRRTKYVCEYRMRTADGQETWVYDQGKVIYDNSGAPVKIYGTSMDMTERKRAEQAIKQQNILLQNIIGNTYDNITVINPDGLTLYGQNKIVEQAVIEFFDAEENRLPAERLPVNRVRNGETIKDEVYLARTPESSHYLLYGGTPIFDDNGQFRYGIIYSHDLTELINIQNALKQSEQTALELVEELKRADRNKNEFINSLSHELRNPLAAIVAGFSLMNLAEDEQKTTRAKGVIQRQINQLCRLVDDLLDVTRITNNKIVLKKEAVELVGLASSVVEDHQMMYAKKGIELGFSQDRSSIALEADPVRIRQIIGNLLQNAAKFTDQGGQVSVAVSMEGQEAVIRVKDSGIGIKPEFLGNLFEPFKQANATIARSEGGLGLGLSIVKGIAILHGGNVRAHSEGIGKGTEFTIRLPAIA